MDPPSYGFNVIFEATSLSWGGECKGALAWHDLAMALNEVARTMLKELDLQDPPYPTISKLSHCPNRVKLGGVGIDLVRPCICTESVLLRVLLSKLPRGIY